MAILKPTCIQIRALHLQCIMILRYQQCHNAIMNHNNYGIKINMCMCLQILKLPLANCTVAFICDRAVAIPKIHQQ